MGSEGGSCCGGYLGRSSEAMKERKTGKAAGLSEISVEMVTVGGEREGLL